MTRTNVLNYAVFGLAYAAIWLVLLAPHTVASMFGTLPKGGPIAAVYEAESGR